MEFVTKDSGNAHLATPSVAMRNEVSNEQSRNAIPNSPTKKQLEETSSQKRRALFSTSLNSQQRIPAPLFRDTTHSPNNDIASPANKSCDRSHDAFQEDFSVQLTNSFLSDKECDEGEEEIANESGGGDQPQSEEETVEERIAREESESLALARQLMAEEAMASYTMSAQYLRDNADNFSSEDLEALQMAIREEDPNEEEYVEGDSEESAELSYETMLRLGERLGDVKQERWEMKAQEHINKLPQISFCKSSVKGKDENDSSVKCLVCQCMYENGDALRVLPCKHCFHSDCVGQWLSSKDVCPYCRQSIVPSE